MANDKPISFKDPLILAIEAGRKTVTRRFVKPQPGPIASFYRFDALGQAGFTDNTWVSCPYPVGSRLWCKQRLVRDAEGRVTYGADGTYAKGADGWSMDWPWKPATLGAMYCPRWASRITLEVTSVRVERLGEITEEEAIAEGVERTHFHNHRERFRHLWDSINGKREGASWDANPWVWAITFRRVEVPRD